MNIVLIPIPLGISYLITVFNDGADRETRVTSGGTSTPTVICTDRFKYYPT